MTSRERPGEDPAGGLEQVFVAQELHVNHDWDRQPLEDVWENIADEFISDDEHDETTPRNSKKGGSAIRNFMRGPEQSDVNLPEADLLEEYCDSADLKLLRTTTSFVPKAVTENINIWLDDRKWNNGQEIYKQIQWFTPLTLYQELKKSGAQPADASRAATDRPSDGNDTASGSDKIPTTQTSADGTNQQDRDQGSENVAARCLIYIHEPDRYNISALIGSAFHQRAAGLRFALDSHFSSRTSIDVSSSSDSYPTFQLAFSLPYLAWRASEEPVNDARHNRHKQPLRAHWDVSLLDPGTVPRHSFIYEAQITFVITGKTDERTWIGYCFDDARHDGESAENAYQQSKDVQAGVDTDPISFGVLDANMPIPRAFEYFIRILVLRLKLIRDEWKTIVRKMTTSIRKYDSEYFPSSKDHLHCRPEDQVVNQQSKVDDSLKLVSVVKSVMIKLLDNLTKIVDACDGFQYRSVPDFLKVPGAGHRNRLLYDLPEIYRELKTLRKELESLAKRVDEFACERKFRLSLQMNQTGSLHRALTEASNELAKNNGALAGITLLYCSPIALGAGIFSMDENVIQSIPRTFGSFMALTVGLGIFEVFGSDEIWPLRKPSEKQDKLFGDNATSLPSS
ncbi:hypothetical protein PV11_08850 [Exophiala sideris]|uniref:Uncharacterized protein n=1 Tax=Exophiala sideris TaxID=1016849 RepID=A0A0D1VM41_9EURO|nr:hypothetical protein PV11_08850 [Exophiala sideris]